MSVSAAPKVFQGPWEGPSKIAIGIDIGTTQSGVAFAYLQQGAFSAHFVNVAPRCTVLLTASI